MPVLQKELSFVKRVRTPQRALRVVPIDDAFPEKEANELAQIECFNKHLFRPNTYLHKWWARRSGTTFRFILKQLVSDPELRDYYASGGLEGVTVLDPMMGGGTTLHEAVRLGANVIGYDLDPIPVLQVRASLTEIPRHEKKGAFAVFLRALEAKLKPYFSTCCPSCDETGEVQFILYAVRKSCRCGEALVIDSRLLREQPDGHHRFIEDFYPERTAMLGSSRWRLFEKDAAQCKTCDEALANMTHVPFAERYVPLVTVGFCPSHGQFFKATDAHDVAMAEKARKAAAHVSLPQRDSLRVPDGPKSSDLLSKRVSCFSDLFSPRQLIYISTAKELLDRTENRHRLWLALLVSTSLEFNSMLCGYKGVAKNRPGAIRHVFSHHAYSFPHTALESNPVFSQNTSGTLRRLFEDRIEDAGRWAVEPVERRLTRAGWRKVMLLGETDGGSECSSIEEFDGQVRQFIVEQRDSSELPLPDRSVDFVVTDPPYFDSVQYSDLSHFFRVWLQWFLPKEADWQFMTVSSAVAETEAKAEKFRAVLASILRESNRVLRRPHGRLIFTYHHWRAEAWIQLTLALKAASFRLVNSYTVYSESPISVHIRQLKALKHDSILVFQPTGGGRATGSYRRPKVIKTDDSASFCHACAHLLGFCLDSDLQDSEIERTWREALGPCSDRFELVATRRTSASIDRLFAAFRNNPNIPPVEMFLEKLQEKIRGEAQISLQLGNPSKTAQPDVKPPTASGKMRETGLEAESP